MQSVRQGKTDQAKYHGLMRKLLEDVKQRAAAGKLLSSSVAGHLLNVRWDESLAHILIFCWICGAAHWPGCKLRVSVGGVC
jgi:hypothetical protein